MRCASGSGNSLVVHSAVHGLRLDLYLLSPSPPKAEAKGRSRGRGNKPQHSKPEEPGSGEVATTRADGILVLLSPRVDSGQIRRREHKVGRLVEVRFSFEGSPFVVLSAYQHVWSSAKTPQQNRKDRSSLLASLSRAIKQVSARLSLVVAGDFNSSLSPCPRLVGPSICVDSNRPDSAGFQELLTTHKLVTGPQHVACP